MSAHIDGIDQYGAGRRRVTIGMEGAHVLLQVEGSGSGDGAALLTPNQARALGAGLSAQADHVAGASEMTGRFDTADPSA